MLALPADFSKIAMLAVISLLYLDFTSGIYVILVKLSGEFK
jgi:hypothetical protein